MTTPLRLSALVVGVALTWIAGCTSTEDSRSTDTPSRSYAEYALASQPDSAAAAPETESALFESADLSRYLAYGLANSAEIRSAFQSWRAMTERAIQAGTLPEPVFSFGEFLEEVQTRTGPQRRRFGLSQAFPWPGKLATEERLALRRAEAGWQRIEVQRLRVLADIEVAFHEYAFLARELQISREVEQLLTSLEPVVLGRIRSGAGQEDLLRLQVEIGRIEDDIAGLERRRPALSARLADAMNLDLTSAVLPLPVLTEPEGAAVDIEEMHALAQRHNPRLLELQREIVASREALELADYRGKPNLRVGLDYIQTGDALDPTSPGSGDDPVILGFSLSLPVWGETYSAAEREAEHRVRAVIGELEAARSGLRAGVENEAYRVEDAARRIGLYRDSLIPRAREALVLTLTSYRAGDASVLDLIDSERATLEFELSFWRACREYFQGEARLRALTGGGTQ